MSTNVLSAKDIKRDWHLIDAKNQPLGRLATGVVKILSGKTKPNFVPYLDLGDFVVVINADQIKVSGKKELDKKYFRFSGFPGGLREETLSFLRKRKPEEIIFHAVKGMLPKNRLGRQMLKKLHVFAGSDHPFKRQLGEGAKDGQR
jgi:large subunit ribosomal protein L13